MDKETQAEIFKIYGLIDEIRGRLDHLELEHDRTTENFNTRITALYGLAGTYDARLLKLEDK